MSLRMTLRGGLMLLAMTLATATPARAQLLGLDWTLHGGALLPVATFGDYFGTVGATAGLGVAYPLRDRLDLTFDADLDMITRHNFYPTPSMKIWRGMVGVDADLLGDELFLLDAPRVPAARIARGPRIGVDYAGEWAGKPYRLWIRDHPHVSRAPNRASQRIATRGA
jgi:hypothetical protein